MLQAVTEANLRKALNLAVAMLAPNEPPDSRAVSDEFVALAAVSVGQDGPEVMEVIDRALKYQTAIGEARRRKQKPRSKDETLLDMWRSRR